MNIVSGILLIVTFTFICAASFLVASAFREKYIVPLWYANGFKYTTKEVLLASAMISVHALVLWVSLWGVVLGLYLCLS